MSQQMTNFMISFMVLGEIRLHNAWPARQGFSHLLLLSAYVLREPLSLGSSLIRVHIVRFQEKVKSGVHLNIYSRSKKQTTFSGQNKWWDKE